MSKASIFIILIFNVCNTFAQNTIYKEPYDLYDYELTRGDSVVVGKPSNGEISYLYIYNRKFGKKKMSYEDIGNEKMPILSVFKNSITYELFILIKSNKHGTLTVQIEDAIENGEILSPNGEKIFFGRLYPYKKSNAYVLNEHTIIRPGDSVLFGNGSLPNGDYRYISTERGRGNKFPGTKLRIRELNPQGGGKTGIKYEVILVGRQKDYRCDLWNALESGELMIPTYHPKTQSGGIADELIKLKQLMEEGLLTEEEFDKLKKKLLQ